MLNVISGLLSGGAAAGGGTSYESISTVTVGAGGASSVSFSSIPSTYKHLQIRALATSSGSDNGLYMSANGDTSNNYKTHFLYGNGATVGAVADPSGTTLRANMYVNTNLYSTNFGGMVVDILDYQNTNKYKTIRSLAGNDRNGAGFVWLASGLYLSTSAISSLTFTSETNIAQYSQFALYGIKG